MATWQVGLKRRRFQLDTNVQYTRIELPSELKKLFFCFTLYPTFVRITLVPY
jgi:hypothetical protein